MLPLALIFGVIGWLLSQPLGPFLQSKVTTEAEMGGLRVEDVIRVRKGVHRIITK